MSWADFQNVETPARAQARTRPPYGLAVPPVLESESDRMLIFAGLAVIVVAVAAGYLWHGGHLILLWQPAEFLIIGGAAVGILIVSTPIAIIHAIVAQFKRLLTPAPARKDFSDLLVMMYQLFRVVQSTGVMALESHIDNPTQSAILSKYPAFLKRHSALHFLSDSARVIIIGGISAHDFDALMYEDLEVKHKEAMAPSHTINKIGDAMPGMGIVAAVLGVVVTMQAIDGPPSEIGHKVGAALVGTFIGILLAYGMFAPLATIMEHRVEEEAQMEHCIKAGILAIHKGFPPAIAIEFARRAIPEEVRPSFDETERLCKASRTEAAAAAAAA